MEGPFLFLSPAWITAAQALRDEYEQRLPKPTVQTKINVVINDVPAEVATYPVKGYIDTSAGQAILDLGHIDEPDLVVTTDYETAKIAFVTQEPQAMMQAMLQGKILVEGDPSALVGLQSAAHLDQTVAEMFQRLAAITITRG